MASIIIEVAVLQRAGIARVYCIVYNYGESQLISFSLLHCGISQQLGISGSLRKHNYNANIIIMKDLWLDGVLTNFHLIVEES